MRFIYSNSHDPYFNLAAEEYLMRERSEEAVFFYRNTPCIVVGKHQNAFDEINQAIQYYTNDPSSSALVIRGESKYFEGSMTQSRIESYGRSIDERQGTPGDIYASASVTYGESFKDNLPLQPFISGSRINPLRSKIVTGFK